MSCFFVYRELGEYFTIFRHIFNSNLVLQTCWNDITTQSRHVKNDSSTIQTCSGKKILLQETELLFCQSQGNTRTLLVLVTPVYFHITLCKSSLPTEKKKEKLAVLLTREIPLGNITVEKHRKPQQVVMQTERSSPNMSWPLVGKNTWEESYYRTPLPANWISTSRHCTAPSAHLTTLCCTIFLGSQHLSIS